MFAATKQSKTRAQTILAISSFFNKQGVSAFLILSLILTTVMVWFTVFSPAYIMKGYYAFSIRLLPFIIWLLSINVSALGLCVFLKNNDLKRTFFSNRKYWRLLAITTMIVIFLFLLIAWIYPKLTITLKFGRYSVPILITQILIAWVFVSMGLLVPGSFWKKFPDFFIDHVDLIIFILIWTITAFLWVNQPIGFRDDMSSTTIGQHIKPLPPNFEIYPRLDSSGYFYMSESIVTGAGMTLVSLDKSLFLAFEGLNNWLTGGSYEKMLDLQTILLASFPAFIYLLGYRIHSRSAGLLAAALAVMQEINGIRLMENFPVVSSKVLLTEPFMQLWTAIIALSGFLVFKQSVNRQFWHFLIFGGFLGLSALVRLNILIAIPFILFVVFIHYFRDRKVMIWSMCAFLIGTLLAITPWMIHSSYTFGDPLAFVRGKIQGVIKHRYEKITDEVDTKSSFKDNKSVGILPINYAFNNNHLEISANLETTFAGSVTIGYPTAGLDNISNIPQILVSVVRHTLNNIITSFSILPTSIRPQDLFHGARSQRFWCDYDATLYEGINPILIVINLLVISIGISGAIKNHKIIGLVPIAIFLGYHFSNGIAVSSGNRYTQPVSWIVLFYFALGLTALSKSLFAQLHFDNTFFKPEINKTFGINNRNSFVFVILFILLLGSAPVIADLLPINRFPNITEQQISSSLFNDENLQNTVYGNNIKKLLSKYDENSVVVEFGRTITPILVNDEEFKLIYYGEGNYGKAGKYLTFMFLGPGSGNIRRMFFDSQNQSMNLPNASDVVVIFSLENANEALAIGIIDPVFASQVSSYNDLSDIPLRMIYFSEILSKSNT